MIATTRSKGKGVRASGRTNKTPDAEGWYNEARRHIVRRDYDRAVGRRMSKVLDNLIPPSSGQRFAALDGLRGLAALAVVFQHLPTAKLPWLNAHGSMGVGIFYVLSAFLLYYPWAVHKPIRVGDYYRRRVLRIYPAYLVALLVGSVAAMYTGKYGPVVWGNLLSHVFFVQTFFPEWSHTIVAPTWSLCAEVQFYLVLPLLAVIVAARRWWLLLVAVGLSAVSQVVTRPIQMSGPEWENWPQMAMPFFFGMLAALIVARQKVSGRYFAPIGLVGMYVLSSFYGFHFGQELVKAGGWSGMLLNVRGPLASAATACTIIGLASADGTWRKVFSSPPARLLGITGYGLFLFHRPIFVLLIHWWGQTTAAILGVPLAILCGGISYFCIEAPTMHWKRSREMPVPAPHVEPRAGVKV